MNSEDFGNNMRKQSSRYFKKKIQSSIELETIKKNLLVPEGLKFKRTNQSCSPSNTSQSISVEWRTCDREMVKQFF